MACSCNDDALRDLVAGKGTSVEWKNDHTVSIDIGAKHSRTMYLEATERELVGNVKISAVHEDEVLDTTPTGLTAGTKNYTNIGTTNATRHHDLPQPVLVTADYTGTPVISNTAVLMKSLYVDNPSTSKWMRVLWTHHHAMPNILSNPGFSMWVEVQERLFGTGNPSIEGKWNIVDKIYYVNDTNVTSATPAARIISYPSVAYHASGTIAPSASFLIESKLKISGVTGNATWREALYGRSDALGSTTNL